MLCVALAGEMAQESTEAISLWSGYGCFELEVCACSMSTTVAMPLLIAHAQLARTCLKHGFNFHGLTAHCENHEYCIPQNFLDIR